MANHAPGPWDWDSTDGYIYGSDHLSLALVQGPGDDSETVANAFLIAAAPELLEALERLSAVAHDWLGPKEYRERALTAIAKARGEAVAAGEAQS